MNFALFYSPHEIFLTMTYNGIDTSILPVKWRSDVEGQILTSSQYKIKMVKI